ncbi:phosphatase PAP2 family protein [Streptomyces sp. NPDC049881]|uniref:phosphatase PAP2 family protein n=1 Tax=Streptomyces sp. NPDC049881 TaxID=3155778 RepID=UPI003438CF76
MRTDRLLARLEQEPQPPDAPAPVMSRTRVALLWATLGFYAAIVAAVLSTSWLVRLDWQVMLFRPYKQWPEMHAFLDYFVVLGQRGPTAALVVAWLGWRSWRTRTPRPLLVMACALLLLNVTVGAAKIGMGREGPHYATVMGSNEMFLTGDIFPSGHTANAVVTWGILAYLATTPRARRGLSVIAALCALGVGATTVYLGTHWVSDVLLGWAAGLLILLALPWCEPVITRVERLLLTLWGHALGTASRRPGTGAARPLGVTPLAATASVRVPEEQLTGAGEPARLAKIRLRPATAHPHQVAHPHQPDHPGHPGHPEHPARPVGSH